ncbi:GTPase-activating protein skywalker-like [Littorina saxatilis]|uniref:TBC1 domain family member 24 n=2 Tax=Littorina saxatilis TaxID=31220 RepID=A0AAN9APK7_9CAEN
MESSTTAESTMVDPGVQPSPRDTGQVEDSTPEPCKSSGEDQVESGLEAETSFEEREVFVDKEARSVEPESSRGEEEEGDDEDEGVESNPKLSKLESTSNDSVMAVAKRKPISVVLSDGEYLDEETDVDVLNTSVSFSIGDSADMADMNDASFMSDKKTVKSSSKSGSSSVKREELKEAASLLESSSKSASVVPRDQSHSHTSQRPASEESLSSSLAESEGRTVSEKTAPEPAVMVEKQTIVVTADTHTTAESISPHGDGEISAPHNGSGDATETGDSNHQNLNLHANSENENNISSSSSHEPFTHFVDVSRLSAELSDSARGDQSGNTQEQELRSLVQGHGDTLSRKQLKKVLRSGLWGPASTVRKVAWRLVCDHLHKLEKAYVYLQMEKELFGDCEDEDIPIPTWPQQPPHEETLLTEYYLTAKGKNTAHKILAVIGQLSPHITYCPGLLPLTDLFLHYMDEAECFSCVFTLLQSNSPVYLMQSRIAFEASKRVLRDLTKKYAKSAYVSLVRSCTNVDVVFDNWMGWIYSDLPFHYVVAVTDSYLMEGMKVLYRVVLAILILYTKMSGPRQRGTGSNVARSIADFCQNMPVPPARLLKVAFKIRDFSRRKIMKLQHSHEMQISSGGGGSGRPDVPRVASSTSMGELSMAVSNAVSMAQANAKMMGFHDTGSNVLTVDQIATIWSWLPARHAIYQPQMLFNSADLGTSLTTLYARVEFEPCTIFIIKTITGEVFGAFCAESWMERRTHARPVRFFGTGETFLFTLVPERMKFEWVGKPDPHVPLSANMFQAGDQTSLLIGGGNGCAIQLDGMMERCRTETCDTFNNPPLCPSHDFIPTAIEVFGMR